MTMMTMMTAVLLTVPMLSYESFLCDVEGFDVTRAGSALTSSSGAS
jgi:hypothetical protein